jgi:hypothetical protein
MLMADTKPLSPQQITKRRDEAVRRALNTPPKPHKNMKKGTTRKKRQDDSPTASNYDGKRT